MDNVIFKKTINNSEKKFSFIHVPSKYRKFLGDSINITTDGKTFTVKINKVGRMVSRKLFEHLEPKIGDIVILEKNSDKDYVMMVKSSKIRSKN